MNSHKARASDRKGTPKRASTRQRGALPPRGAKEKTKPDPKLAGTKSAGITPKTKLQPSNASRPVAQRSPKKAALGKPTAKSKKSSTSTAVVTASFSETASVPPLPGRARLALTVPAILLEGDEPTPTPLTGTGQKFVLSPASEVPAPNLGRVTKSSTYGTGTLSLVAREPHSLYAAWDLTSEQQRHHTAQSASPHLVVRVYQGGVPDHPVAEVQVRPESHHSFIPVAQAGATYLAWLGYYQQGRQWITLASSTPVQTPPDAPAPDKTVRFATFADHGPEPQNGADRERTASAISPNSASRKVLGWTRFAATTHSLSGERLATPLFELDPFPISEPPIVTPSGPTSIAPARWPKAPGDCLVVVSPPPGWTAEQEQALAELIGHQPPPPPQMGSLEIAQRIGQPGGRKISPPAPVSPEFPELPINVSSPLPAEEARPGGQGFWFNVNAELVIYGATEPDARVTIGGRLIRLRPDGTFSYRFALPDGTYSLPMVAVSKNDEARQAEMGFSRWTLYVGEVGAHPQDPGLRPASPEGVA